jgi:ribosomal protein S18 acetylase RimI-like enzyme
MLKEGNNELTIRQAIPEDWEKILPLFEQLYHGDIGPDLRNVFAILARDKENSVLIAEQNEKPVGVLAGSYHLDVDWEGKIAKLQAVIIDEKHRNRGVGKKLLCHFLTQTKENNCRTITLRVNQKNISARLFYEKLNFSKAETDEYILAL